MTAQARGEDFYLATTGGFSWPWTRGAGDPRQHRCQRAAGTRRAAAGTREPVGEGLRSRRGRAQRRNTLRARRAEPALPRARPPGSGLHGSGLRGRTGGERTARGRLPSTFPPDPPLATPIGRPRINPHPGPLWAGGERGGRRDRTPPWCGAGWVSGAEWVNSTGPGCERPRSGPVAPGRGGSSGPAAGLDARTPRGAVEGPPSSLSLLRRRGGVGERRVIGAPAPTPGGPGGRTPDAGTDSGSS